MAPHSSTLAWKIPWTEEPSRLQSMGLLAVGRTEWLYFHFSLSCIGEGNGNPLQCSCLENPRDGGAWWTAIYGVAQSWTWLKQLTSSSSMFKNNSLFIWNSHIIEHPILNLATLITWQVTQSEAVLRGSLTVPRGGSKKRKEEGKKVLK